MMFSHFVFYVLVVSISIFSLAVYATAPTPLPPYNASESCDGTTASTWGGTTFVNFPILRFTSPDQYQTYCFYYIANENIPFPDPLPSSYTTVIHQTMRLGPYSAARQSVTINTETDTVPLHTQNIGQNIMNIHNTSDNITMTYDKADLICDFPQVLNYYFQVSVEQYVAGNISLPIDSTTATRVSRISHTLDSNTVGNSVTVTGYILYKTSEMYFALINTQTNKIYTFRLDVIHDTGSTCPGDCFGFSGTTLCGNFNLEVVAIQSSRISQTTNEERYNLVIRGQTDKTIYVRVQGTSGKDMWKLAVSTTAITDVTPAPSPQSTQAPPAPVGDPCFPGDATVVLRSGKVKLMRDLQIGDQISTGSNEFSTVFFFSHRIYQGFFDFIRIETADSKFVITVSPNHYLIVNEQLIEARQIKVGDHIQNVNGTLLQVTDISPVSAWGLYAPHTMNDKLIVDGIQASVYTTSVNPVFAWVLLAPLKLFYKIFGFSPLRGFLDSGIDILRSWMPRGPSVFLFTNIILT